MVERTGFAADPFFTDGFSAAAVFEFMIDLLCDLAGVIVLLSQHDNTTNDWHRLDNEAAFFVPDDLRTSPRDRSGKHYEAMTEGAPPGGE
jgi:hypothetical protein